MMQRDEQEPQRQEEHEPDNYAELRIKWRIESREGLKRAAIWLAGLSGCGTLMYAVARAILRGLGE